MQTTGFRRCSTAKIGVKQGRPRVFVWGGYLLEAGIRPAARIEAEYTRGRVVLRIGDRGERVVHEKEGRPVVDINTHRLREAFPDAECVRVTVTDRQIELTVPRVAARRASRCRNGKEGGVFAGGGLLAKAAQLAGLAPSWSVEKHPPYAETYEANFRGSSVYNLCISDTPYEALGDVEAALIGLPCEGFSSLRRTELFTGAKREKGLPPEAYQHSDLALYTAALLRHINPSTIIIEEAPSFLASATGYMLQNYLRREGYEVSARVVEPNQYGYLQNRRRSVIVAHEGGFDWDSLPAAAPGLPETVGEILEPADAVEGMWFTFEERPWMAASMEKHAARGSNFAPHLLTEESTTVPALKKDYLGYHHTEVPMVRHPSDPHRYRYLTLAEVRKLFTLPDDFVLPSARTVAGAIMCQGVIVDLFRRIIGAATGRARSAVESFMRADEARGQLALAF